MRTWLNVERRALLAAWRASPAWRRLTARRHLIVSASLTVAGLLGALGGGWLIGRWCLGLVLLAESAGAIGWGLFRDDGQPAEPFGAHTVGERLAFDSARMDAADAAEEAVAAGPQAWPE